MTLHAAVRNHTLGRQPKYLIAAALLLATHLWLGLAQMTHTSPTFDEAFYIARGWAWWRTGRPFRLGHPLLASQLAGLGSLLEPALPEPESLAGWDAGKVDDFSRDLLWKRGLNAGRMVFMARAPFLLISLALGALTAQWARRLYGTPAGLIALGLHAISPNILANAPLAATDLVLAAFFVAAWYAFLRALDRRSLVSVGAAGALLGLAQASKFSAPLLALPMATWVVALLWRDRSLRPMWTSLAVAGVGLVTLWAAYGFALRPYPLAGYFEELSLQFGFASDGHGAYLLGKLSRDGWWYFHPLALLVKTPLPLIVLIGLSGWAALTRRARAATPQPSLALAERALLLPALMFLAATMLIHLSIGYRYLLPLLPLLHIFAAGAVRAAPGGRSLRLLAGSALGVWSLWAVAQVYPNYLAYFNETAGGPRNGWRVLADSNLDWGQSLPALARAIRERGAGRVFLSYFGQADPAYYGLHYETLPGWPPPSPEPDFYPLRPQPGLYTISASTLVGAQMYNPNALAWFRQREPDAVVDHTFFLYEVPERPKGEWFYQCAAPVPLLNAREVYELTGANDLAAASFNCETALLLGPGAGWVTIPGDLPLVVDLGAPDYVWRRADGSTYYRVYHLSAGWQPPIPEDARITFGESLTFLGATAQPRTALPGEQIQAMALWRVERQLPPPISIYAHLLSPDGTLIAAGDALGAPPEQWHAGDRIVQQHTLPIPSDAPPGEHAIRLGLYRLDTGERYLTPDGQDGVQVGVVTVGE